MKNARTGTFADSARFGDVVVLAVKGTVAEAAVDLCESALAGKAVLDTTNPSNDEEARAQATALLAGGWEIEDLGSAASARAIEPFCMLWCIPGLQHNRWSHAFKLLKK
jgi:predicted dinucleotide-binding enzyme